MGEKNKITAKKSKTRKSNRVFLARKNKRVKTKAVPAVDQIFSLQNTLGNQVVQRLSKSRELKAKLRIGKPGDKYEKEADKIADKVMRMPELSECLECKEIGEEPIQGKLEPSLLQRQSEPEEEEEEISPFVQKQEEEKEEEPIQAKLEPLSLQRQVEPEEEEKEPIQAKSNSSSTAEVSASVELNINSLKGGGQPLSERTREYFEPKFGYDFSGVRVHNDSKASEVASSINAKAFTSGRNVVFGAGEYSPETDSGKHLLAHELTHVIQQSKLPSHVRVFQESFIQQQKTGKKPARTLPPGEKYREQFRQLHIEIGKRLRARAITNWAMSFFQSTPAIPNIAKAMTKKIDDALLAVNKIGESLMAGFVFDLTNWFPGLTFRESIDFLADLYVKRSHTPWLITYRIPRAVAVAVQAVEDKRGKCEEHAFLAVYLLTVGHMIQNMPFGQLRGDIFYTGAATTKHGIAILVKGSEFKNAIIASKKKTGKINPRWLCLHTNLWGKSAWIIDGWEGKAEKLAKNPISLDYVMSQTFRRNVAEKIPSKWDVTVDQMAKRVASIYGIK
jgi:hypothetical protein